MIRRGIILLAALSVAACDLPTEPPRWEQTWVIPAEPLSVSVAELLPASVTLSEDGALFRVATTPVAVSASLADMCGSCAALDGTTAPKPGFTATLNAVSPLPGGLLGAALAGGSVEVVLEHDFDFDPLRPSADPAQRGYLLLTVTSNGALVAGDSISGEDTAFPAGAPLTSSIPVQAVTVSGALELEIRIYSPPGDEAQIRASDTLGVTMPVTLVDVLEATIHATDLDLGATVETLEFDLDESLLDRVRRGALRFDVHNPFQVTGSLELRLDVGARVIDRSVAIEPGDFSRRIELSGTDLRDILGAAAVTVTTTGSVSAAGDMLTVRPSQELVLEPSIEVVLLMGGQES
jgi:hypothetical protein